MQIAGLWYDDGMFLNTRNFFLYLLCVAVLIIAIAVTAVSRQSQTGSDDDYPIPPPATTLSNEATVIGAVTLNREEKLALMREKVSQSLADTNVMPLTTEEQIPIEEVSVTTSDVVTSFAENRCDTYVLYQGVWEARGLTFSVVEGARLLQREVGASSTETVLQLPLRTFPSATGNCITSDVVGIALDGSLIRNGEVSLYSVFGQETLIGYALDGFPIYGVSDKSGDACGGLVLDGHYQYHLRTGSDYILGCYSGAPVTL